MVSGLDFYTVCPAELMSDASPPSLLSPQCQQSHPVVMLTTPVDPARKHLKPVCKPPLFYSSIHKEGRVASTRSHALCSLVSSSASFGRIHDLGQIQNRTCSLGCCQNAGARSSQHITEKQKRKRMLLFGKFAPMKSSPCGKRSGWS